MMFPPSVEHGFPIELFYTNSSSFYASTHHDHIMMLHTNTIKAYILWYYSNYIYNSNVTGYPDESFQMRFLSHYELNLINLIVKFFGHNTLDFRICLEVSDRSK